jgi:riboflavin synthase
MFTGIVETVGKITAVVSESEGLRLTISSGKIAEDVNLGDSVAINGVCLTVVEMRPPHLTFQAVYETVRRSSLSQLATGDSVNLERALPVGGRLGGHIMQGHVDGVGHIASIRPVGNAWMVYVDTTPEIMRYIVNKGSVAVDGISLTVAEAADRTFSLSVIPHTWENSTLKERRAGDRINIECDIIGKYVEKLLGGYIAGGKSDLTPAQGVTMDLLARSGYVMTATRGAEDEEPRW